MDEAIRVTRCTDSAVLAGALARELAAPTGDPFAEMVVCVDAPGTARWLAHQIAGEVGISAGIAMPGHRRWTADLVDALTGVDPDTDPWQTSALGWRILRVLADSEQADWGDSALGRWVDPAHREEGSVWLAHHVAQVLQDYCRRRPALIRAWNRGHDGGIRPDLRWQFDLWRRLHTDPRAAQVPDPVSRLDQALTVLANDEVPRPARAMLAPTLHLWAPQDLQPTELELLQVLAGHTRVHVWLPAATAAQAPAGSLADLWGREHTRTLQDLTAAGAQVTTLEAPPPAGPQATVLMRLHHLMATGHHLDTDAVGGGPVPGPDLSLRVHACHGLHRQIDVARDAITSLLQSDPDLQPRDVVVMCADPEAFPMVEAAFTTWDPTAPWAHPITVLPHRFADPSRREHNPLVEVLVAALTMGGTRATATQLADFLTSPAVAARFDLDEDMVERAEELVRAAEVRWGMNTHHREKFGMGNLGPNTWMSGLNRLLVGVAMSEDGAYAVRSGYPLDDISSSDLDVIGAISEVMARLVQLARTCEETHTPAGWADICRDALDSLTLVTGEDTWQEDHIWTVLEELTAPVGSPAPQIGLDDLLDLLADARGGRVPRSAFRTGALTVCSLTPLRHVPHKVVCIIGMEESALPRPTRPDGDNMADLHPAPEELRPHHRQRQLWADAVASARHHLVVTYTGTDPATAAPRSPSVLVTEMLDAAHTVVDADTAADLVVHHPVHAFSPAAFPQPGPAQPFGSYDPAAWQAAHALATTNPAGRAGRGTGAVVARQVTAAPFTWPGGRVDLAEVIAVLTHPAREFLRHRAHFTHRQADDADPDAVPIEVSALDVWGSGNRVLQAVLRGDDLDRAVHAELLRATLPPGEEAQRIMGQVRDRVATLAETTAAVRSQAPHTRHVEIPLGDGMTLVGDITLRGTDLLHIGFGRVRARHRLQIWAQLLALQVAAPHQRFRAHLFGRGHPRELRVPEAEEARTRLQQLVDIATVGLTHPLPLPIQVAETLTSSTRPGLAAAELGDLRQLRSRWDWDRDANWEQLWGNWLGSLTRMPRPEGVPRFGEEPTWMADLARTIWTPLLAGEVT